MRIALVAGYDPDGLGYRVGNSWCVQNRSFAIRLRDTKVLIIQWITIYSDGDGVIPEVAGRQRIEIERRGVFGLGRSVVLCYVEIDAVEAKSLVVVQKRQLFGAAGAIEALHNCGAGEQHEGEQSVHRMQV